MSARTRAARRLGRQLAEASRLDGAIAAAGTDDPTGLGRQALYARRNRAVLDALATAGRAGVQAGIRLDPESPDWPVVQFELPHGQVSWHVPGHPIAWDGHQATEKTGRIAAYTGAAAHHARETDRRERIRTQIG